MNRPAPPPIGAAPVEEPAAHAPAAPASADPDPGPVEVPAADTPAGDHDRPAREILGWLWGGYLRPHMAALALAALLLALEGGALGLVPVLVEPMFDRVFVAGDTGAIALVGAAVLGLFVLRAGAFLGQTALLSRVGQASMTAMQSDLVAHLMRLSPDQLMAPGALMERVQGDTQSVLTVWKLMLRGAARDLVALVALMGAALAIDPVWTLAALVGTPALVLPMVVLQRYVRRKTRALRETAASRSVRLSEIFHGHEPIVLGNMQGYQRARFDRLVHSILRAEVRMTVGRGALPALVDVATGVGFLAVLVVGGRQVAAGEKSLGEFMAFFTAMALAFQPLRKLGALVGSWQTAAASLDRLMGLFDLAPAITAPARPAPPPSGAPEIRFEDVRFGYGAAEVLRGLTFAAPAGRMTALVGPSGSGKSTALRLIPRLIEPRSGRVTLDGVATTAFDPVALREAISVVAQDAMLFDETIEENVTLGREVAPETLRRAVDAAQVAEFADRLPSGLSTPAGVRGSALSGGQRQRVAIARALLRDAPVLLLDEATSALDARSEAAVRRAIAHAARGRTTIVIAHRLETIRAADHIVVLQAGRAEAQGTHEALSRAGGLYADLLAVSAGSARDPGGSPAPDGPGRPRPDTV